MRRLPALRWLSSVLLLSGLLGSFPPPARAHISSHACCRGERICHCPDHGSTANAAADPHHDRCMMRAAGCSPPAATAATSSVMAVLAANARLTLPARQATAIPPARDAALSGAIHPDSPPPRFPG
jgi:hypothetical protein